MHSKSLLMLVAAALAPATALAEESESILVDYVILVASPARESRNLLAVEDRDLRDTISALQEEEGPLEVELYEALSLRSRGGEAAEASGARVSVSQLAGLLGDKVLLKIEIDPRGPNKLVTTVDVPLGKTRLVGRSGLFLVGGRGPGEESTKKLFYFVKARAAGASSL